MTVPGARPLARFTDEELQVMLRSAGRAPSVHNTQPWEFVVSRTRIDLYADPRRQLRRADPTGRSLLVSCGAALFNLRVAAEQLGFRPRVRRLPDRDAPTLVASLAFDHRLHDPGDLAELYPAVELRRTNRLPFEERPVEDALVSRLCHEAALENAMLRVYSDPDEVLRLVKLVHDADSRMHADPAVTAERAGWIHRGGRDDGIPASALGPRPEQVHMPFRDLAAGPDPGRENARFERTPTIAVLSTRHDTVTDWVRAGEALERVLLAATTAGLSASFVNQPLEIEELRWLVRSPMTGIGHPQMVMRVGYGRPVPPTPRRPLEDLFRVHPD
ncbi:MAG TPA: nitroreductase [Actinomycetes bacterium]